MVTPSKTATLVILCSLAPLFEKISQSYLLDIIPYIVYVFIPTVLIKMEVA